MGISEEWKLKYLCSTLTDMWCVYIIIYYKNNNRHNFNPSCTEQKFYSFHVHSFDQQFLHDYVQVNMHVEF